MRIQPGAVDGPSVAEVTELYRRHMASGRAALSSMLGGVMEVASHGAWVTAQDGTHYLDFGGYAVFILGHRHPDIVAAVRRQLDTHPLGTRVFLEPVAAQAAAALAGVAPAGLDHVHFVNSGAEATEAAIKLARAHGRNSLVCATGGFHGKTLGALSVTSNELYQSRFRPLVPDVTQVPFGSVADLRAALAARPGRGCLLLEPVQGEAGVVIPPDGYLQEVAAACADYGALLVVDEIQTGLGRLGSWFAVDREGVVPDILLVGKGLSGGIVPVAAMVTSEEIYAPFGRDPFLHSSTFGASPLACAAALATIETMKAEDTPGTAALLGLRLLDLVHKACAPYPDLVAEVRGRGLLIGIEFRTEQAVGEMVLEMIEHGVLVNHSLNASRVLRFTPPARLAESEVELFDAALIESLDHVATRVGAAADTGRGLAPANPDQHKTVQHQAGPGLPRRRRCSTCGE